MKENKRITANRAMHGGIDQGQGSLIMAKVLFCTVFLNQDSVDFHIHHEKRFVT